MPELVAKKLPEAGGYRDQATCAPPHLFDFGQLMLG